MPDVMVNWHHGLHLDVILLDVAHISDGMLNLEVSACILVLAAKLMQYALKRGKLCMILSISVCEVNACLPEVAAAGILGLHMCCHCY